MLGGAQPLCGVGADPTAVGGVGLVGRLQWACCCCQETTKKEAFGAPSSHLGNDLVEKPQQQKNGVYSWLVPWSCVLGSGRSACAETAKSQELGQGFWWNHSFRCLSKYHLHCLWGLELLRMVQLCENSCVKGQGNPSDTSFGSSIWTWLALAWKDKLHRNIFVCGLKTWKLLEIKSVLVVFCLCYLLRFLRVC